ncbi:hypothetical protein [Lentzea sp. NPDC004782]|uniref:hypothetical protein n=1 Tax=Lentzea sp. NPDC004782 TaxID=3154458 RepID=UPI0033A17F94
MAGASMTPTNDRFPEPVADPEMRLDIRIAEGAEAERLRLEQAQVLMEVTQWLARRRSETGSTNRAA